MQTQIKRYNIVVSEIKSREFAGVEIENLQQNEQRAFNMRMDEHSHRLEKILEKLAEK